MTSSSPIQVASASSQVAGKRATLSQSLLDFQEGSGQAQEHSASVFFHAFPSSKSLERKLHSN